MNSTRLKIVALIAVTGCLLTFLFLPSNAYASTSQVSRSTECQGITVTNSWWGDTQIYLPPCAVQLLEAGTSLLTLVPDEEVAGVILPVAIAVVAAESCNGSVIIDDNHVLDFFFKDGVTLEPGC